MIKIENVEVVGLEHAIRGMRNPKNSWDRSDSKFCGNIPHNSCDGCAYDSECIGSARDLGSNYILGPNDYDRAGKLAAGGPVHAKYRRMIVVYLDITSHHTWWSEFDTYKIGTVRNSCSKMHTIHIKEFVKDDFSHEGIDECGDKTIEVFEDVVNELERLRVLFNETKEKKYWRAIIEILPMGFNIKATIMLNYEVLTNIYTWRHNHKLDEWVEFCKWIEELPYSELITGKKEEPEIKDECEGCVYRNSTDIQEHLRECTYCKRAYSKQHNIDAHEDNYQPSESHVAEWKDKVMKTFLGGED